MSDKRSDEDYDRGHVAGTIDARLAGHDKHFAEINGSLKDLAREMAKMVTAVQRLGDQAIARDATVVTTAAALKDAEEARRSKSENAWSPLTRISVVLGILAAIVGLYFAIVGIR